MSTRPGLPSGRRLLLERGLQLEGDGDVLAEEHAAALTAGSLVRMVCGEEDETFANNRDFHAYLKDLRIPHDWIVLPGVGHDPFQVLTALGDRHWAFYRAAFGSQ